MRRHRRYPSGASPEAIVAFLIKNGPTTLPDVAKHFDVRIGTISRNTRKVPDQIEQLSLTFGGSHNPSRRASRLFNIDQNTAKRLLAIPSDSRVIDFYVNLIKLPLQDRGHVSAVSTRLRRMLGNERATKVMDEVYTYSDVVISRRTSPKAPLIRRGWIAQASVHGKLKFTDDEFLDLYLQGGNDTDIGQALGVSTPAVQYRRTKFGLDPSKMRTTKLLLLRVRLKKKGIIP